MYNLTKSKHSTNEILKTGSIEECIYFLCSLEDNIYHALAHKGYCIFDEEEKIIDVSYEVKEKVEYQYRKDLYFYRVNKINEIIKSLDLTAEKETIHEEENKHYYPDNIHIFASDKQNNKISFSMEYNNKGKVTLSTVLKRDKENNYLNIPSQSISFNLDKDLQKIKNDIEKRFYPLWQEVLKNEAEKLQSNNDYIDTTLNNLEDLKGEALTERERQEKVFYPSKDKIYSIKVSRDSIYLTLQSLNVEDVKKIMKVLN